MLSIFSCPKPFLDSNTARIQRNALRSWTQLSDASQICLLGDDPGVKEAAEEFHITHFPEIEKAKSGIPLFSDLLAKAKISRLVTSWLT